MPRYNFNQDCIDRLTRPDDRWTRIEEMVTTSPASLDLTDNNQALQTFELADLLLDLYPFENELTGIENRVVAEPQKYPTILHLAVKLALSKTQLNALTAQIHLTVVVPLFKEHNRIRSRKIHPAGEDFIRRKVAELNWLYGSKADDTFDLIFVDDGCPEKSGLIASDIIAKEGYGNVRVLFLEHAIASGSPMTKGLNSTEDSQKGGAIQYGLWEAIHQPRKQTELIVLYTDADLSTNIGQAGLLIKRLSDNKTMCVLGSRYDPGGIYCTPKGAQGLSDKDRLRLIFRHYVRAELLPQLGPGVDTQCGFKAIKAEVLADTLKQMVDKRFSFDMELLLLITLNHDQGGRTIAQAPIVWIESNAESNFY
ncbi:MAG: glycosyltransferase family 2 protein [Deltaproteobacteria bacterium]|nr:glycosyltransferase family 2 protein [Deltaproteobacteria bacterium]